MSLDQHGNVVSEASTLAVNFLPVASDHAFDKGRRNVFTKKKRSAEPYCDTVRGVSFSLGIDKR
jgi:hypothetical protein